MGRGRERGRRERGVRLKSVDGIFEIVEWGVAFARVRLAGWIPRRKEFRLHACLLGIEWFI